MSRDCDLMRKKIVKIIEAALPRVYNSEGEPLDKKKLANAILDKLPNPERFDLEPFEQYIPFQCSECSIYNNYKKGCSYLLFDENYHQAHPAPENCPLNY
jgi:hypothetical protein